MSSKPANIFWIGGGSGAGKSTIARLLAAEHDMTVYATDDAMAEHSSRATAGEAPHLASFRKMSMDERWLTRSPKEMLETFPWFLGEGFRYIVEDLRRGSGTVVAEGFRLLPRLVQPHLEKQEHAVWLLPTPDFRRSVFESRGGARWSFLGRTSDPDRALQNLLARDAMFTEQLRDEARRLRMPVLEVDFSVSEYELTCQVAGLFGLRRSHSEDEDGRARQGSGK